MELRKILMVSRPITKDFDEGSKNLVKNIIQTNEEHEITFLSNKSSNFLNCLKVYSDFLPFFLNRFLIIRIFKYLKNFDVIHFFYTPSILNLIFISLCRRLTNAKFIHSIPTANKFSLRSKLLKRLFVCDIYVVQSNLSMSILKKIKNNLKIFNIRPAIKTSKLINNISKENKVIYPGDYRLNSIIELFKLCKIFSNQDKYTLIIAFRVSSIYQKILDLLLKVIIKISFTNNVLIYNRVQNIENLFSESVCVIFPASKMNKKIDIPHSIIEPMFLKTPVIINNIQPLNEINKDILFDFFTEASLLDKLESLIENKQLVNNNFEFAKKNFGNKNVISFLELYK